MIQLNYNTSSNIAAILPDIAITSSTLYLEFIQDYDKSKTYATASTSISGSYIIFDVTGSQLPSASGLYTVNFYTSSLLVDVERAYVSGSNEVSIIRYTGSLQTSTFITYNG